MLKIAYLPSKGERLERRFGDRWVAIVGEEMELWQRLLIWPGFGGWTLVIAAGLWHIWSVRRCKAAAGT